MKKQWIMMAYGLVVVAALASDVPLKFNYQGVLKTGLGDPVSSQTKTVTFQLFDASSGGAAKWGRDVAILTDDQGLFNVELSNEVGTPYAGLDDSLASVFNQNSTLFLELTVDGHSILPRQQLLSVPFAMLAGDVKNASAGFTVEGDLTVNSGADIYSLTVQNGATVNGGLTLDGKFIQQENNSIDFPYDLWIEGKNSGGSRHLAMLGAMSEDQLFVNFHREYSGGTSIGGPVTIFEGNLNVQSSYKLKLGEHEISNVIAAPESKMRIAYAHIEADGTIGRSQGIDTAKTYKAAEGVYYISYAGFDNEPLVSATISRWKADKDKDGKPDAVLIDNGIMVHEVETGWMRVETFNCANGGKEDSPFDLILIGVDTDP